MEGTVLPPLQHRARMCCGLGRRTRWQQSALVTAQISTFRLRFYRQILNRNAAMGLITMGTGSVTLVGVGRSRLSLRARMLSALSRRQSAAMELMTTATELSTTTVELAILTAPLTPTSLKLVRFSRPAPTTE